MSEVVIPAEAVEAARDAMQQFALIEDRDGLQSWDAYARLALEAATPHMVQAAYDLGFQHGSNEPANPFRATK